MTMFRTILGLGAALALMSGAASAQDAAKYVDEPAAISARPAVTMMLVE